MNDEIGEKISVLIPWRDDGGPRRKALDYCLGVWSDIHPDAEIILGVDDGDLPFNCSAAQNRAFKKSTRPWLLMFGADCLPDREAIEQAARKFAVGEPWVPLFDRTEYYDEAATRLALSGREALERLDPNPALAVPFQTGVVAVQRWAYLATGGMDERFVGWGAEDSAFRRVLAVLFGDRPPINLPLHCLWHPAPHRGAMSAENLRLVQEYEQLHEQKPMREYLAARGSYVD